MFSVSVDAPSIVRRISPPCMLPLDAGVQLLPVDQEPLNRGRHLRDPDALLALQLRPDRQPVRLRKVTGTVAGAVQALGDIPQVILAVMHGRVMRAVTGARTGPAGLRDADGKLAVGDALEQVDGERLPEQLAALVADRGGLVVPFDEPSIVQ
jgi:hypothetical protein